MPRYRIYLLDEADFVQKTAPVECHCDADAMDYARTLIRRDGRVELWIDALPTDAMIGWIRPESEPFDRALVHRSRSRPAPDGPRVTKPVAERRRMCMA